MINFFLFFPLAVPSSLQEDLKDGASAAWRQLSGKPPPSAKGADAAAKGAFLAADADLMEYVVKGDDRDWSQALSGQGGGGSTPSSVSLRSTAATPAGGGAGHVERLLAEAVAEADEGVSDKKKKKRARILGGGFNENKVKEDSESRSKKRKKGPKKPEGKYKNL